MGRYLGLIVKATRLCNLRCTYCHDWRSGPNQTMPFEVLTQLTAKALRDPEHDSVEFIWHGGEPDRPAPRLLRARGLPPEPIPTIRPAHPQLAAVQRHAHRR